MKRTVIPLIIILCFLLGICETAHAASEGITLNTAKNQIFSDNAIVYGTINNPQKKTVSVGGCKLFLDGKQVASREDPCAASYRNAASVPMSYDMQKELNYTLKSGTTYTYTLYAIVGGSIVSADGRFTTSEGPSISLNTNRNTVSSTNAIVYGSIINPEKKTVSVGGCKLYLNGKLVASREDPCAASYRSATVVPMSYDMQRELKYSLMPGTTYTYVLYATVGGTIISEEGRFTTNNSVAPNTMHVPCYYTNDRSLNGEEGGCRVCSMAMTLTAIGIENATLADVYRFCGGTWLASTQSIEKKFGVIINRYNFSTKGSAREKELTDLLSKLEFPIVYVNINAQMTHACVAYLDGNGNLKFNDPGAVWGDGSLHGEAIQLGDFPSNYFYSNSSLDDRWDALSNCWIITNNN